MSEFELVLLKSGIHSLRCRTRGETFHPGVGPQVEARILHIDQQRLIERCQVAKQFVIWDVGLGAAANVLGAIEALSNCQTPIEIHSFDRTTSPLEFAMEHAVELGYPLQHKDTLETLLKEKRVKLTPNITWILHLEEFHQVIRTQVLTRTPSIPSPNAIFYDPYSPKGNPEMWTLDVFTDLFRHLDPQVPCTLTNYTRSTPVRVALLLAGFSVGTGTGIGIKSETTIAANHISLLEKPLDRKWLNRVRLSTNSAPLREAKYSMSIISEQDFKRLQSLPQFHECA